MRTRLWIGLVALLATTAWLAPATANAQARRRDPYPYENGQPTRVAYDNGYRQGLSTGERDGRAGRNFEYQRETAYQRADQGYPGYGDRNSYRALFRQGYTEGYRSGYSRYANQRNGSWGNGDPRYGAYPGSSTASFGYERGYSDGINEGRNAARGNDRYDPYREKRYRDGDNGYDRRYGAKDSYKQVYRDGFLAGYERGYRESRSATNGRGWPW